jgi:hypothetical protein
MPTTDDEMPAPGDLKPVLTEPDTSSLADRKGPGGYPAGGVPPMGGPHPPIPQAVDRLDPLGPDQLRAKEIGADRALFYYRSIKRVNRNLANDPSMPYVMDAIRSAVRDYRDLNIAAHLAFNRETLRRNLIGKLDMTRLENINAFADAETFVHAAWLTWRKIYETYRELYLSLHQKEKTLPPGTPSPPDDLG